jgi:hypothetical protein
VAAGAGTCAKMMFDINQTQRTLRYNFMGLPGAIVPLGRGQVMTADSMDQLLTQILTGRGHRFYCSQFVAYVYQFVARQNGLPAERFFSRQDTRVSPSTLASLLQQNRYFAEAGYLVPGVR